MPIVLSLLTVTLCFMLGCNSNTGMSNTFWITKNWCVWNLVHVYTISCYIVFRYAVDQEPVGTLSYLLNDVLVQADTENHVLRLLSGMPHAPPILTATICAPESTPVNLTVANFSQSNFSNCILNRVRTQAYNNYEFINWMFLTDNGVQ